MHCLVLYQVEKPILSLSTSPWGKTSAQLTWSDTETLQKTTQTWRESIVISLPLEKEPKKNVDNGLRLLHHETNVFVCAVWIKQSVL